MIPFQERKKIRKILYSKVTLTFLALALFFVARGAWSIHKKAQVAISERDIAQRSFDELENRTLELQASLTRFKSDKGMEEELRQKYTVARSGEEVVTIVDDAVKKGENGEVVEKSFWQRITSFFGL